MMRQRISKEVCLVAPHSPGAVFEIAGYQSVLVMVALADFIGTQQIKYCSFRSLKFSVNEHVACTSNFLHFEYFYLIRLDHNNSCFTSLFLSGPREKLHVVF